MKIALVSGSQRQHSESARITIHIENSLKLMGLSTYRLDLATNPLPFWDDTIWKGDPHLLSIWNPISSEIKTCDAAVFVSPEWAGMVPAALKNFFLYATDGCLYHKPGLIVGVSASRNGAYPVNELRISSYKNTHIHFISEHVIIRNATQMLKDDSALPDEDRFIRGRITYGLQVLKEYAVALKQVRESGVLKPKEYPFGM